MHGIPAPTHLEGAVCEPFHVFPLNICPMPMSKAGFWPKPKCWNCPDSETRAWNSVCESWSWLLVIMIKLWNLRASWALSHFHLNILPKNTQSLFAFNFQFVMYFQGTRSNDHHESLKTKSAEAMRFAAMEESTLVRTETGRTVRAEDSRTKKGFYIFFQIPQSLLCINCMTSIDMRSKWGCMVVRSLLRFGGHQVRKNHLSYKGSKGSAPRIKDWED